MALAMKMLAQIWKIHSNTSIRIRIAFDEAHDLSTHNKINSWAYCAEWAVKLDKRNGNEVKDAEKNEINDIV